MEERDGRIWEFIWQMDCRTPPTPSDLTKIDGYGNPKAKFTRTEAPECMKHPTQILDAKGKPTGQVVYETKEQQEFINQEVARCYFDGYWCFIRGQLTWIPYWYYFFLNYWRPPVDTEDGRLEYRDAQRVVLLYLWNVINFTKDMGLSYLKGRRNFATAIGHAIGFIEVTKGKDRKVGLSSSDFGLSEENYSEMFSEPVKLLPSWLTPIHENLKDRFVLREPRSRQFGVQVESEALGGDVTLKALTKRGFDGRRIHFLFGDEGGKWKVVDIGKWLGKQIKTMMAMGKRIGFAWLPTTAEEIEEGGKEFRKLFEDSDVKTMKDGKFPQTLSKLRSLFRDSAHGWPGFVGPYGEDIIDYPDDEQWEHMLAQNPDAERIGSDAYLTREVQQKVEAGDEEGAALLRREAPRKPGDAWSGLNGNCPFEVNILTGLKAVVEDITPQWVSDRFLLRGEFYWMDQKEKTQVGWKDNPNGPIRRTNWIPPNCGKFRYEKGSRHPLNTKLGIFGVDPYSKENPKHKGSDFAVKGKRSYNPAYEAQNKDYRRNNGNKNMPDYHPTPGRFFSFVFRSSAAADHEQAMMAALFYSMPFSIESNRAESFFNYLKMNNMDGFILREWQILGIKHPTKEQFHELGIFTGGDGQTSNPVIPTACVYFNDFLRGDQLYLGANTYDIVKEPERYPFVDDIQDNLEFDITDRGPYDSTMGDLMAEIADFNINDYSNPLHYIQREVKMGTRIVPPGFYRTMGSAGKPTSFRDLMKKNQVSNPN